MQTLSRPRPTIHIHSIDRPIGGAQLLFPSTRKRKRSLDYSSEDDETGTASSHYTFDGSQRSASLSSPVKSRSTSLEHESEAEHRKKKPRRALVIENRMGDMSLDAFSGARRPDPGPMSPSYQGGYHQAFYHPHHVEDPHHLEIDDEFRPRDEHHLGDDDLELEVITPSVEEAESPVVQTAGNALPRESEYIGNDAKMRGTSWWEPEKDRIIITNLDDDSEVDDDSTIEDGMDAQEKSFSINPAYLQRLKAAPTDPFLPSSKSKDNMALVAYRPMPTPLLSTYSPYPHGPQQPDNVEEPIVPAEMPAIPEHDQGYGGDAMELDD